MKNVLVIGNGGREHALAWKLSLSPRVQCVYVAPGNGGTALEARVRNISIPVTHLSALADFADREAVDFTVVGPEAPLAAGIVDLFRARGLRIFGPTRACAQLESSKAFAKAFMQRHGIPTAASASFADPESAHPYVERQGAPIVIKADGLAAGKGVVVAHQLDEAHAAIETLFGNGSACVVIEEYLSGEEASFIVMADGEHVLPLASSQDHKRLGDGDTGPNTGGMGAYSPAPVITPQLHARIMREIIWPAVRGMAQEGIRYTGFLYAGLMIDAHGAPKMLEFNCRLGDPETQPILMRLQSDLATVIERALSGALDSITLEWDPRAALGVALAARGYPDAPRCGDMITGLPASTEDVHLFHAGTTQRENQCLTSGGRVLCVTGLADSIEAARARTYSAIAQIHFDGMHYRRDIGARALA
ncbi:Phosphoribosylglycinamide synthetase (GAR synthetase) (Phosphoribosylamine--glycine ligase) (Glycinamide ribonucleotide synthetase) [Candidatus Glomeribacter gigasporarum BEG34]|uniref:Phosphoribosylamine--glycine ligase n=1 Tax=Candidatus Glomeribacter gigasporarum BEG34 TaxID=1070319 RepID=G2JBE3_9BURK|nr:phosphoribosylamine--glycine ligase [Candidatus Glomeribacter gigasporarum]CCD30097.1 Phosphoribosylglycinamide synthetase (GAR synthetase) (Phosphoribosylamine--glycine ligase) (Glycinamide ribonucleotide synthetase) [Candidatus Glomeribacter gigasporarum BEG34]